MFPEREREGQLHAFIDEICFCLIFGIFGDPANPFYFHRTEKTDMHGVAFPGARELHDLHRGHFRRQGLEQGPVETGHDGFKVAFNRSFELNIHWYSFGKFGSKIAEGGKLFIPYKFAIFR